MKNKNPFWDYFEASRSERTGFLIFFFLCVILYASSIILDHLDFPPEKIDFTEAKKKIQAYYDELEAAKELFPFDPNTISKEDLQRLGLTYQISDIVIRFRRMGGKFKKKEDFSKIYGMDEEMYCRLEPYIQIDTLNVNKKWKSKPSSLHPFPFNPNTISKENLIKLGLSNKVVKTIINYRNKKGKFYQPTDFLYIYGVTKEDFRVLEPYIRLEKSPSYKKKFKQYQKYEYTKREVKYANNPKINSTFSKSKSYPKKELVKVDINQSTPERWQLLYGIGPKLSKRITKFRDKLGGFYSIDQVASVYGLPDSTFQRIKPQLTFSPILKKLDINSDDINVLKSHPYLSWKKAQILLNYRENHGDFERLDDLREVGIFSEEELERLGVYLAF